MPLPAYERGTNLVTDRTIVERGIENEPYVGSQVTHLSDKTNEILGFCGEGVAKVKVEYVGRAPLQGSDDRKLAATLREGVPGAGPPVLVASNKSYAPTYFDSRSLTQVPAPPDRPYRLSK